MATDWAGSNGDDDDDAALRRAIAMSLGEPVPEIDRSAGPSQRTRLSSDASPISLRPVKVDQAATSSMSALGLDRRQMEEERLARSRKRKAETSDDTSHPADSHVQGPPPSQRARLHSTSRTRPSVLAVQGAGPGLNSEPSSAPGSTGMSKASSSGPLQYPKGIVLRTWARGSPRDNDITIEEVLQKDDLELAVLSSFQWDEDWLLSKLDLRRTKTLLIAYAEDDKQKAEMRSHVPASVVRFVFPPMTSVAGCMHSKLQLLKYKNSLRIVIPTGNLVAYDWGETGTMENMVFLIDLPLVENSTMQSTNEPLTPFGEELCFFLKAQGMDAKMISSLRKYDFSATVAYAFVHTIAGSHIEPDLWQRTGYCGLGRNVTALGLDTARHVQLDYVCSSVGAVKLDLLTALHNACQGDSGLKEYEARTRKSRKSKDTAATDVDQVDLARVRVYFPSHDTVLQSQGGTNSAGTICFQSRWWNAPSFPQQILRDCRNTRPGVLMHSKILFVRSESDSNGWAYIGSHNLSESAWGRLVKDRSGKPKLNARNWECGVLVVAKPSSSKESGEPVRGTRGAVEHHLSVFRGSIPVPMELPAVQYHGSPRQPWFVDEA